MDQATTPPGRSLPYAGLRVLDASQGLAGPYCGMLLAQHGAQVVKLEPPGGDWGRAIGTRYGDHSALALACNQGKRSLVLDLKRPGALQAVRRLADGCDVFIESFRPGVAARLQLGHAELSRTNPSLVYCSVSGYGQSGPYAQRPGSDTVIQAFSGFMSLTRDAEGWPTRVGCVVVDTLTALYAFQAVQAALYARRARGAGAYLDVSLMQSAAAFLAPKIVEASLEGESPRPLNAPAGIYRTLDGWIAVTLTREGHWPALCRAIGREDLAADPRYGSFEQRADALAFLRGVLEHAFAQRTSAEWLEHLAACEVMANPVNALGDWLADEHVRASGAYRRAAVAGVGEVAWPRIPGVAPLAPDDARARSPGVGHDGEAVLAEFGFTAHEIDRLRDDGSLPAAGADAA